MLGQLTDYLSMPDPKASQYPKERLQAIARIRSYPQAIAENNHPNN